MQLTPYDYLRDTAEGAANLIALAPLIAAARREGPVSLLCDCGDFLQGSPLADEIAASEVLPHPVVQAFNALNYDAVTLGNHDFDYGLPWLVRVLRDLKAPVVSTNLTACGPDPLGAPFLVLHRSIPCSDGTHRPLRIGLLGMAPPQIVDWNADVLDGALQSHDIMSAVCRTLPQLTAQGVDLVVALCHGGPVAGPATWRMENAALHLAQLPEIDAVLMGHMHGSFPGACFAGIAQVDAAAGTLAGTPAIMASALGQRIGILDLDLRAEGDAAAPRWTLTGHAASLRGPGHGAAAPGGAGAPSSGDPIATALARHMARTLAAPHAATLARLRRPIGHALTPLTSYFAAIGHDDTAPFLAQVQADAVRAALHGTAWAGLPVLASTAPFRAGGHGGPQNYLCIAAGTLRLRDCTAMVPFDNRICAILRRGWQIRDWLVRSSAFFNSLSPGLADQPLLNRNVAPYHFDTLHGIRYRIDLAVPPGQPGRIVDLTLDGAPLAEEALCIVATSSYRARGGGDLVAAPPADLVHTTGDGLRSLLAAALRRTGGIRATGASPWSFSPVPGASAILSTSPAALAAPPPVPGVTPIGPSPDGYAQFRLSFDADTIRSPRLAPPDAPRYMTR